MNIQSVIGTTCACLTVVSFGADAALVGRLATPPGGTAYQAYYDTEAGITWSANTKYPIYLNVKYKVCPQS